MGGLMNILQILPYPIVNPIHGGQLRAKAINDLLSESEHSIISCSIYDKYNGYIAGKYDIAFNEVITEYDWDHPKVLDFVIGEVVKESQTIENYLVNLIDSFKIDAIILEQPWFFKLLFKISKYRNIKLIYSSHNIEYRLKFSMLDEEEKENLAYLNYIDAVESLEASLVAYCDLIICCTEKDKKFYDQELDKLGLNTDVIVAGNAVEPFDIDCNRVNYWKNYIKKPYAVFVGSAHEPNSNGFWTMMSPGLTFLAPDEEIVVVGGVCDILLRNELEKEFDELNKTRVHMMGQRSKLDLQSMVLASHVVLLPICEGEGSNLKTAEALESGRPIVATSKAFRGYEEAMSLAHIYIEDTPEGFRERVRTILNNKRYEEGTDVSVRSKYYWTNQLSGILPAIKNLENIS